MDQKSITTKKHYYYYYFYYYILWFFYNVSRTHGHDRLGIVDF